MEIKPGEIFRIINKKTGESEGVYQRGNYDQHDFSSIESARSSNCHDTYKDRVSYGINKYRVTIELIEEDIDPPSEEEIEASDRRKALEKEANDLGLGLFERVSFFMLKDILHEEKKDESENI